MELICMVGAFSGVITLLYTKQDNGGTGLVKNVSPFFGLIMAFVCAWCFSMVIVLTRKAKKIHFSVWLFHYGLIASSLFFLCILAEWAIDPESKALPRLFYLTWE